MNEFFSFKIDSHKGNYRVEQKEERIYDEQRLIYEQVPEKERGEKKLQINFSVWHEFQFFYYSYPERSTCIQVS